MVPLDSLRQIAQEGMAWASCQPGVAEVEVFASCQNHLLVRLNYTSHIPCHGVEEPKSLETSGVSVHAVFVEAGRRRVGFGSQGGEMSLAGIQRALEKARLSAVEDPDFKGLPTPSDSPTLMAPYHDPDLMKVSDAALVSLGWRALSGALERYKEADVFHKVIVGGDVSVLQERMAVASSRGIDAVDETAAASAVLTSMLEADESKGTGWSIGTRISESGVHPEAAGREAAESALASRHGERIPPGEHNVIFGPQAMGDLINNIILPSLNLAVVDAACSTFQGKLGQRIADPRLTLYDHGALPERAGSRRFTCEGLPTGKSVLIDQGRLVGFLTNDYYRKKMLGSPDAKEKLGDSPETYPDGFVPRNGFRPGESLGRNFLTRPSIVATNVVVASTETESIENLMARVGEGVYVGRIWYTYPMNGLGPGDFTSTIVGDSFLVQNGKKGAALKPNTVRIQENIHRILQHILAFGDMSRPVLLWGSPEVITSPAVAVSNVRLEAISG